MSRHGVTDEDVRRETEQDDDNFEAAKEGGWCCLLELAIAIASSCVLLGIITPLMR